MKKNVLLLFLLAFAFTLRAQVNNGGFETNLNGWTIVAGTVLHKTSATIGAGGNTWNITPAGTGMVWIEATGTPNASSVQTTLGLTNNQLSTVPSITNVGAMYQDVTLTAGQSITAYWNYVSQDYAPYDDGTFATLTGPQTQVFTFLSRTTSNALVPAVQSYGSSGWHSVTLTAGPVGGTFRLGFGSYNWGDQSVNPILFVDNAAGGTAAPGMPIISSTAAATNITTTSASSGGTITGDGGSAIVERGIVYSTTQNPTTANTKVVSAGTTGTFTSELTGLTANTTYYIRAFARNSAGTNYGPQVTFTTSSGGIVLSGTVSVPAGLSPTVSLSLYKVVGQTETLIQTKNVNSDGTYSFDVSDLNNTYKLVPSLTFQGVTSADFNLAYGEVKNSNAPDNTQSGLVMTGTKQWKAADANKNGVLDLGDAFLIIAHTTGLRPLTEVLWFSPTDYDSITKNNFGSVSSVSFFTINVVTSNLTQNIKYCVLGDVNLSHSSQ